MRTVVTVILFGLAWPVLLAAAIVPATQESRARRRAIAEGSHTQTPVWSTEFRLRAADMLTAASIPSDRADSLSEMAASVARMTGAPQMDGATMIIEVDTPDPRRHRDTRTVEPTVAALLHGIMEGTGGAGHLEGTMAITRRSSPVDHAGRPTYTIRIIVTRLPGGDPA